MPTEPAKPAGFGLNKQGIQEIAEAIHRHSSSAVDWDVLPYKFQAERKRMAAGAVLEINRLREAHEAELAEGAEEALARQLVSVIEGVAIPSLRYCEEKHGYDDQARLNVEAAVGKVKKALGGYFIADAVKDFRQAVEDEDVRHRS